jgi:hypothetical protein
MNVFMKRLATPLFLLIMGIIPSSYGVMTLLPEGAINIYATTPTRGITISLNGNVGVGITNPKTTLEVSGTISANDINVSGTFGASSFTGNGAGLWGSKKHYVIEVNQPLTITENAAWGIVVETGNVTRVQAYTRDGVPVNDIQFKIEQSNSLFSEASQFSSPSTLQNTITLSSVAAADTPGSGTLAEGNKFLRVNMLSADPSDVDLTIVVEITKTP